MCSGRGLDEHFAKLDVHSLIWMCATAILTGFSVSIAVAASVQPTVALIA